MQLVPFLESWHGGWDPSLSWDNPINGQASVHFHVFCYDAGCLGETGTDVFPFTNAFAITGPGTAFGDGDSRPKSLEEVPPQTIVVVEVRASGTHWMAPGDFDVRDMPRTINAQDRRSISSRYPGGFHVVFADGSVWFLSDAVEFASVAEFFSVAGAARHDRETALGPFALHRSR